MSPPPRSAAFDVDALAAGVRSGHRATIGRALTLVESRRSDHRRQAQALLVALHPWTGRASRVGVSGVPGVGKSTFIEALGAELIQQGHRVAVLAVDPSSDVSGGSILGDKTRMQRLSVSDDAFVRPSPTAGTLGGVAQRTRESALVLEAAGFDVILIETVGVGQSETLVAKMVDSFIVLMLPNAGDELQGIKKGIIEVADILAVNKSDVDPNATHAAMREYRAALHYIRPTTPEWSPRVHACSALSGDGLCEIWASVQEHVRVLTDSGALAIKRRSQRIDWMWRSVEDELLHRLRAYQPIRLMLPALEAAVADGSETPSRAAELLLSKFLGADHTDEIT